jgi:hypothetical protein
MKKLIIILFALPILCFGQAEWYAESENVNNTLLSQNYMKLANRISISSGVVWSYTIFYGKTDLDKRLHLLTGFAASTITGYCLRNKKRSTRFLVTLGTGLVIGGGKELYDKYVKKTYFNKDDFFYTLTGTAIGIVITI